MPRAFIPGSFDPLHLGHVDVIDSALDLFGEVVVAVLYNREKSSGLFTPDERVGLIEASVSRPGVSAIASDDLAVSAAKSVDADFIVKGLRTAADYEIEQQMAHTNFAVSGVRTVFVPCRPANSFISSRFIREIAARKGDVSQLVSTAVAQALSDKFAS